MDYAIKIVEQSGRELTDYQIRIEITDEEFFSKCTDQKFVEFYDEDQATLLSHYTELFDPTNNRAVFWVKVPSIPANGTKYIYLNINTGRTEDLSDPSNVFDFWDDFSGDLSKWTTSATDIVIENGALKIPAGNDDAHYLNTIYSNDQINLPNKAIRFKSKISGATSDEYWLVGFRGDEDTVYDSLHSYSTTRGWDTCVKGYDAGTEYGLVCGSDDIYSQDQWFVFELINVDGKLILKGEKETIESEHSFFSTISLANIGFGRWGSYGSFYVDFVAVRKYTDPEPSVTVIRLGATPTYDLKLKIAQALSGESDTILDTDPKIRLLSGTDIIKELSLTAKTVYKDSVNNRVVVAFLFVDDSSDSYTTDNQELLFTKDSTEYVAFKSSRTFTKEADKRLPLRWEIYLPYDVDVCTYEETMIGCL